MLSKVIFYTVILIACLALGEGMMSGVRKSVNQMKEVSLKLTKEQVHAE